MGVYGRKGRPVVLVKKTTREVVKRYQSIRGASRASGIHYDQIFDQCNRRGLGGGYLYWRYEDDFDPNESFEGVRKNRPVLAVNKMTGHWVWFDSMADAGRHFFGNVHGAKKAMKSGRECNGYAFVYADRRMRSERCEVEA